MQITASLSLTTLTPEQHARTCGYWYTVQTFLPHTAFRTRAALLRWLADRDLTLTQALPDHGEHSYQPLCGAYAYRYVRDCGDIESAIVDEVLTMSNGDYTVGYVTQENGIRVVNTVIPNGPRVVFDHRIARAHADAGKPGLPGVISA